MKLFFTLFFVILAFTNCKSPKNAFTYQSETLKIQALSDHSFRHISYLETKDFGKVACNGLVFIDAQEAVVFDTPTTPEVSVELIKWIAEEKKCAITAVVINHFHSDCLGGLEAFHTLGIPSFANDKTIALANASDAIAPQIGFTEQMALSVGNQKVINSFLGEAHTVDNIVSYIPSEQLLFGGCMLKALNAQAGFTGDANLRQWSATIKKVIVTYPEVEIVVPGHGSPGNKALLKYTLKLFQQEP